MFLDSGSGERLIRMTRPVRAWALALLLLSGVVLADVSMSWEFGFSAFYLLPVIWLAWSRGSREGIGMALLAGAAWYAADLLNGRPFTAEFYRIWDELNHLLSYLLAAWVVGALRREILGQQALNQQLSAAMTEVRELKGLLPVCAWCHNIRDDEGQWHSMEVFLTSRTKASTTHGICPACEDKLHKEAGLT
jgi:hypothetical protein